MSQLQETWGFGRFGGACRVAAKTHQKRKTFRSFSYQQQFNHKRQVLQHFNHQKPQVFRFLISQQVFFFFFVAQKKLRPSTGVSGSPPVEAPHKHPWCMGVQWVKKISKNAGQVYIFKKLSRQATPNSVAVFSY